MPFLFVICPLEVSELSVRFRLAIGKCCIMITRTIVRDELGHGKEKSVRIYECRVSRRDLRALSTRASSGYAAGPRCVIPFCEPPKTANRDANSDILANCSRLMLQQETNVKLRQPVG